MYCQARTDDGKKVLQCDQQTKKRRREPCDGWTLSLMGRKKCVHSFLLTRLHYMYGGNLPPPRPCFVRISTHKTCLVGDPQHEPTSTKCDIEHESTIICGSYQPLREKIDSETLPLRTEEFRDVAGCGGVTSRRRTPGAHVNRQRRCCLPDGGWDAVPLKKPKAVRSVSRHRQKRETAYRPKPDAGS